MTAVLTILYDNESLVEGVEPGWGFSCLVEMDGHRLLFDTGWDGDLLLRNARVLGVDLSNIDGIMISHDHWDHAGGLPRVLKELGKVKVHVPASFSKRMRGEISRRAELVEVRGPAEVGPGLTSTGPMGEGPVEQSLLIGSEGGVSVVTGCAHQGLESVLDVAESAAGKVKAVIGGFHGFDDLERLKRVEAVWPCHCTVRRKDILDMFKDRAHVCGAGSRLHI